MRLVVAASISQVKEFIGLQIIPCGVATFAVTTNISCSRQDLALVYRNMINRTPFEVDFPASEVDLLKYAGGNERDARDAEFGSVEGDLLVNGAQHCSSAVDELELMLIQIRFTIA